MKRNFPIDAAFSVALLVCLSLACASGEKNSTDSPSSTGNPSHDQLVAFSPSNRAMALGKAVEDGCVGEDSFFMGMGKDLSAYWSVRCSNGKSYQVQLKADADGSTKILDCEVLKVIAKVQCFKKLDEQ